MPTNKTVQVDFFVKQVDQYLQIQRFRFQPTLYTWLKAHFSKKWYWKMSSNYSIFNIASVRFIAYLVTQIVIWKVVSHQAVPGCNQNFTRASQLPMAYEFSSLKWGKLGEILIEFFRLLDSSVLFRENDDYRQPQNWQYINRSKYKNDNI